MLARSLAVALLVSIALPAAAQRMAPGLWEVSMQMPGASDMGAMMGQMSEQLAKMPPEQRKQMEAMLAQQGGAPKAPGGGPPGATRMCISKEMADRGDVPDPDGRCRQESLERRGNRLSFKFTCSGDPPSSGTGEYVFSGDKGFTGKMLVNTVRAGKPQSTEMQLNGRFVATDCGDVKPRK